jgi:hypothetical protein
MGLRKGKQGSWQKEVEQVTNITVEGAVLEHEIASPDDVDREEILVVDEGQSSEKADKNGSREANNDVDLK